MLRIILISLFLIGYTTQATASSYAVRKWRTSNAEQLKQIEALLTISVLMEAGLLNKIDFAICLRRYNAHPRDWNEILLCKTKP